MSALFGHLFLGEREPSCLDSADANDDGALDLSDGIFILEWLSAAGREPLAPGPAPAPCGADPTAESELGCASYTRC